MTTLYYASVEYIKVTWVLKLNLSKQKEEDKSKFFYIKLFREHFLLYQCTRVSIVSMRKVCRIALHYWNQWTMYVGGMFNSGCKCMQGWITWCIIIWRKYQIKLKYRCAYFCMYLNITIGGFCTHSKVVFSYQLDCSSERLHDTGEKGRICMLDRKETRQSNLGISFIEL